MHSRPLSLDDATLGSYPLLVAPHSSPLSSHRAGLPSVVALLLYAPNTAASIE